MGRPLIGPARKVRVAQEVWDDLCLIAAARGVTVSDLLREAMTQYVRRTKRGGRGGRAA